jgi:hypothetical protein
MSRHLAPALRTRHLPTRLPLVPRSRLGLLSHRLHGRPLLPIALRLPRPDGFAIGFDILAVTLASGFAALFLGVVLVGSGHGGSLVRPVFHDRIRQLVESLGGCIYDLLDWRAA